MAVLATTASTLHSEITSNTYAAPPTVLHRQILSALRAAGILQPNGAYVAGKSQADLLREISVPSIHSETLYRVFAARGI